MVKPCRLSLSLFLPFPLFHSPEIAPSHSIVAIVVTGPNNYTGIKANKNVLSFSFSSSILPRQHRRLLAILQGMKVSVEGKTPQIYPLSFCPSLRRRGFENFVIVCPQALEQNGKTPHRKEDSEKNKPRPKIMGLI